MGVRGLRSFIREKRNKLLIDLKLQDTKLIIDGSNLLYFLHLHYEEENVYGGNYDHFTNRCKGFFKTLLKCHITPIVVFDGADDPDNMKLDTVLKRLDENFKKVNKWQKTEELLPILSKITLCQILEELNILQMACVYEADKEIAVLANRYACPVLSDDSDFYVYNLKIGSISMACMVESERRDLAGRFYIPVKLYQRKLALKEVFQMENDEYVFPVFATLVGNDIFDPTNITLSKPKNPRDRLSCATRNLRKILEWFQTAGFESGETALDHISTQVSQQERIHFKTSVHSYLAIDEFSIFDLEAFLKPNQIGNTGLSNDEATCSTERVRENQKDRLDGFKQCMTTNQLEHFDNDDHTPNEAANIIEASGEDSTVAYRKKGQDSLDQNGVIPRVTTRELESSHNTCAIVCETICQREFSNICSATPIMTISKLETSKDTNVNVCGAEEQREPIEEIIYNTHLTVKLREPFKENMDKKLLMVKQCEPIEENVDSTHLTVKQRKPIEENIDKNHLTVKKMKPLEDNSDKMRQRTGQAEPSIDTSTSVRAPANQCEHIYHNDSSTYLIANDRKSLHDDYTKTCPCEPSIDLSATNQRVHEAGETSEVLPIELKDCSRNQLPSWFVNSVIKCKIDCTFILNVTQNHRLIFKAQAEMHELPSSFKCSQNLRRVIYRIVTDPEKQKHKEQRIAITEFHRTSTNRSQVTPIERLQCVPKLPCLETIPLLSESERKNIVYAALGALPIQLDQEMDETSQILMSMLRMWKAHSRATECHVNTLIIGILALHIFDPTGYISCLDILDAIKDADRDNISTFKKRMEKHFCKQYYLVRRDINKEFIHRVSCFQAIFLHTYHLNQLLLSPVRMPSPGVVLNSTFNYSMCHLLENNVQPKNILGGEESSLYCLFKKWKNSIKE